jgi:hypothetical protein
MAESRRILPVIAEAIWMANPVEKERSVMDRVKAGELSLADITPVKIGVVETSKVSASYREAIQTPERASEFRKETAAETVEMEAPREAPAARREGKRAAREEGQPAQEEKPEMEAAPAQGGKRDLAAERPVKSDEFDVAFEEESAPVQKSAGKKKKGDDEDFLF